MKHFFDKGRRLKTFVIVGLTSGLVAFSVQTIQLLLNKGFAQCSMPAEGSSFNNKLLRTACNTNYGFGAINSNDIIRRTI